VDIEQLQRLAVSGNARSRWQGFETLHINNQIFDPRNKTEEAI